MKMGLPLLKLPQEDELIRTPVQDTGAKITLEMNSGVHWENDVEAFVTFVLHKDKHTGETIFSGDQNHMVNFGVQMLRLLDENDLLPYALIAFKNEREQSV